MEPVDVLGDDHLDLAGTLELDDGGVCRIGSGRSKLLGVLPLLTPVRVASLGRPHELLVVDRAAGVPHSLRPPVVRDAAGGGDARSGEDEDALGRRNQGGELRDRCRAHDGVVVSKVVTTTQMNAATVTPINTRRPNSIQPPEPVSVVASASGSLP